MPPPPVRQKVVDRKNNELRFDDKGLGTPQKSWCDPILVIALNGCGHP